MKRALALFLALPVLMVLIVPAGCSKGSGGAKLADDLDSVAYIVGLNIGWNLQRMDSTLRIDAVCEGIRDAFGRTPRMTPEQARTYYLAYMNYTLPEKARAYEEQFLADIAKSNRSYARTSSGVTYTVDDVGDQNLVPTSERDSVLLRWVIRTADGTQVASSYERGDTVRSLVRDLCSGVQESVRLIGRGGRIKAWIPAAEAYGSAGDRDLKIAPNATLYYEIELVGVDKYATRRR